MRDFEGAKWLIENEICDINEVDPTNHDALWYALGTESHRDINRILEAGAHITPEHIAHAAKFRNFYITIQLLVKERLKATLFR